MTRTVAIVALGLALGACAGPVRARTDAPETPPITAAPALEPPRQADGLQRVASELVELQNAVAKLMMSARQHDEQLVYLQRRLTELEAQARGRAPIVPGFAPPGAAPAPLPAPPTAPAPLVAPPTATLPRSSSPPVVVAPTPSPRPVPPAAPASPAEKLLQSGLAKYQAGDLDGAVVALYEVVSAYPRDPARERAQFMIADIFYTQKDYRGAIAEFESLVAAVPGGARVPEALLKIGMAQRAVGDEVRARRTWERLVKEHPSSASARQARTLLKPART